MPVPAPTALRTLPTRPTAAPLATRRLNSLTGLRAIAAFTVFAYHLRNTAVFTGNEQATLAAIFGGGASAVSLFFILSGFVLAWAYRSSTSMLTTWSNRLLRILPLHAVAWALALLVAATVVPAIRTDDPLASIANLFLVSAWRADWWQAGNPVSWSLVCEAFFYLLSPFLIRGIRLLDRGSVIAVGVLAMVLTWAIPTVLPVIAPAISSYSNPLARLPEFVFGIVLAVLMLRHGWRGPRLVVAVPVALTGYIVATTLAGSPEWSIYSTAACTILGFGLLIAGLARADVDGRATGLSGCVGVWLGNRSFAFYLVHLLALQAVVGTIARFSASHSLTANALSPWVIAVGAAGSAIVVAALLHSLVEAPIVRRFRREPDRPTLSA